MRRFAFADKIDALREFQQNQDRIVIDAVQKYDDDLIHLQRQQLYDGVNNKGEKITPEYSKGYKARKAKLGLPVDRVTLFLKGEYYARVRTYYGSDFVRIFDDDFKNKWLGKSYPDHLGLNEKSKSELRKIVLPEIRNAFKRAISVS